MAITAGWLRNFFWRKANPERGEQLEGPRSLANESAVALSEGRSLEVSTVFSCIRLLSEIVGSLSLGFYERQGPGRRIARDDHPLAQLLMAPNPFMTGQEYIEAIAAQLCGWGNAYSMVDRNDAKRPVFLWPLQPSNMQVIRNGFDSLTYRYTHHDKVKDLEQSRVVHTKGFGTDGIIGLSPLGHARQVLGVQVAAEQYAAKFYAGGGLPSGVMMIDKPLTPKQREDLKANYGPLVQGEGGGNSLWILEAFAKYVPISISPEDAQMLLTRQFQVGEIARIFRVPLFLLMEMEKSTSWGTGLEQQNLAFLTYTLRPYLTRIENSLNRWLLSDAERKKFYFEFNIESLLRADSKTRFEVYSSAVQNGLSNRNEVRAKENMEPFEGGDVFTVQANLLPIAKLGEQREAAPPAQFPPTGKDGPQVVVVQPTDIKTTEAMREMTAGHEKVVEGMKALTPVLADLADEKARGNRLETALGKAMTEGFDGMKRELNKPRLAVFDEKGDPIGTRSVDSLE